MTVSADRRGWGPGWPHNNADKCIVVRAERSATALLVRKEVAPIVKFCLDEVERRGYLYDHGPTDPTDDWGFANRPIRGTSIPSNHSWGLAVDLDASQYPQGQNKIHPPQWVMDIWFKYRFDNGDSWKNPDPMHYEFNGTPNDAAFLVASLAGHAIDNTPAPMPPSAPPPPPTTMPIHLEDDPMKVLELHPSPHASPAAFVLRSDGALLGIRSPEERAALERVLGPAQIVGQYDSDALLVYVQQIPLHT